VEVGVGVEVPFALPSPRDYSPLVELGSLILLSLCLGLGAWLLFLWSVKTGQYDDPEGPKYRMMDDDDEPKKGP
jgi:cbb3-type cytochrome oxidase maturation protein